MVVGVAFTYLFSLIYHLVDNGFYILLTKTEIDGKIHHLRDYILPKKIKKSYREIAQVDKPGCSSRSPIFSKKKKEVFYLDIVRLLTEELSFNSILLLGGGGCSLASYFANNKKIKKIDVIEYNSTMIKWAKKYFLKDNEQVRLILGDGLKFSKLINDHYDLIIIDMFNDFKFNKNINNQAFIKDVQNTLGKDGVFIINLGFALGLEEVIGSWRRSFPLYVYLSKSNLLLSNVKFNSFKFDSPHRFLFKIPQSIKN
jgi:predicted O-methyltransferase YrrM